MGKNMAKLAIIKTGGKQYKVKEGQTLLIEKLDVEAGASVKFDTLLTSSEDAKDLAIGKPSLGELVEAKVLDQIKDDKVKVVKYKSKTRYLRNKGHRQNYTKVQVTSIK
jgi:large subunit ribosomal protein L21